MRNISILAAFLVLATSSFRQADAGLVWADVTTAGPTTFSGTVGGVAFTGTFVNFGSPFTNTAGTSNFFSGQPGTFTPSLPTSDSIGAFSEAGFTLSFAQPVVNPVFDIFSLTSTLDFGTPVTLVSAGPNIFGGVSITVSGNRVIGQASGNGFDANGTFELSGSFSSLTVTAPVVTASDGISFIFATQVADDAVPEPSGLMMGAMSALALTGWGLLRKKRNGVKEKKWCQIDLSS
jgi:hypothetical protein